MVSCKGLFLYHHLFHRLRPEIHLRQKYLQQYRPPRGLYFCKLSLPPRRAAADLYQLLRRKSRQLSGLSQWGSKYLGDQGYSAIEIIRYYYGNDMYINAAQAISGVPSSWPGYDLTIGASGPKVRQIQEQLNRIAQNYPAIPKTSADGIFGPQTAAQVRAFQRIFNLPATGIVDYPTWYQISNIYVAVSRIAEPGT